MGFRGKPKHNWKQQPQLKTKKKVPASLCGMLGDIQVGDVIFDQRDPSKSGVVVQVTEQTVVIERESGGFKNRFGMNRMYATKSHGLRNPTDAIKRDLVDGTRRVSSKATSRLALNYEKCDDTELFAKHAATSLAMDDADELSHLFE